VQTNIYNKVAWYIARYVVCLQSYRPTETVWCNRFTQQNPKPKLVSVFLNRLRPKKLLTHWYGGTYFDGIISSKFSRITQHSKSVFFRKQIKYFFRSQSQSVAYKMLLLFILQWLSLAVSLIKKIKRLESLIVDLWYILICAFHVSANL